MRDLWRGVMESVRTPQPLFVFVCVEPCEIVTDRGQSGPKRAEPVAVTHGTQKSQKIYGNFPKSYPPLPRSGAFPFGPRMAEMGLLPNTHIYLTYFFNSKPCTDSTFVHNCDFFVYKICTKVFLYNSITY